MNFELVLTMAHGAAARAVESRPDDDASGFVSVNIPSSEELARHCRKQTAEAHGASRTTQLRYGRKARKGWEWWFPGDFRGQSIDAHEAGAKAFRDELIKNGIEAQMSLLRD